MIPTDLRQRLVPTRIESALVVGGLGVLAALLVAMAAQGLSGDMLPTYVALGAAVFVALLSVLGAEKMGLLLLTGGFFTAPFYKGTGPSLESPVTATDALVLLGFMLLLPRVLAGRVRLPTIYWVGTSLVLVAGLVSSAASVDPVKSYISLVFWMIVMIGLPVTFAAWNPSLTVIDLLASSFVVGQMFSFAAGWAKGYIAQGRHGGLATHPNYFAEGGMLALALLVYLAYRHFGRSWLWSTAIVGATAVCAATVYLSGSRAALVVVAVLVLMIPFVERSALIGFVMALFVALAIVALPILTDMAGKGSALDRLTGGSGASQSDSARFLGLDEGIKRFLAHPIRGDGLVDLFDIHNNYLEVAVATGVFGLVGYLLVLYTFARPVLGPGRLRRLCYPVFAYIGFGATVPSLYDRSIWTVVSLSVVAMIEYERIKQERASAGTPEEPTTAVTARPRAGATS